MLPPTQLKNVLTAPVLKTVKGFGSRLVGSFPEPATPGSYYKQFVLTVLYVPIFFGHIYLVEDVDQQKSTWRFLGRLQGDQFISRFGWTSYFRFKGSSLVESALMFLGIAALLLVISFVQHHIS
jgi:hypothetical protein